MKQIKIVLLITLLIASCKSTEKLLQQGNYNAVIEKSIKNILKGKADNDDKLLLDKAYNLANQQDKERIKFLKSENRPENWEEIYRRYNALNIRQNEILKVSPLSIGNKKITYEYTDYSRDIIEAKTNAAKYYYHRGLENMDLQTKDGYRQAYFDFQKVLNLRASDYPKLQTLIQDAEYYGTSRVLVETVNSSMVRLPDDIFNNILNLNLSRLNSDWIEYYVDPNDREIQFDYIITVELQNIIVSREKISRTEIMRKKEIQDGYEYILDRRGNVKKDSLGNDIKVPKYRQLACTLIEVKKFKTASINGVVRIKTVYPKNNIKSEPVAATSVFENFSAKAIGDLKALGSDDLMLLKMEVAPFPDDLSLIYDCSEIFKQAVSDLIYNNRRLIK